MPNRELWIIETNSDFGWKPQVDLVYETGRENAEIGARQVEESNAEFNLKARATLYIPMDEAERMIESELRSLRRQLEEMINEADIEAGAQVF